MSDHSPDSRNEMDLRQALHELSVHKDELETQNEELRRVQQELEAARSRYFDLYNLAPVGYCTLSDKGMIVEANLTLANLLAMDRGAILRKPLALFVHEQDHPVFYKNLKQFLEDHQPMGCEVRMLGPGSDCIWARLQGTVREGKDDAPSFRVVVTDITKRIQAREASLKTEAQFQLLVDNSPEAIFIQTQGRFAYANKACQNLYGAQSPGDLLGTPVLDRVHPDIRALVKERIRLLNEQRAPASLIQQKQFTLDGRLIHVEVSAVPFHYNGHDGAMVFVRDITKRKQAEEKLQQYQLRLEQLVEKRTGQLRQEVEAHRKAQEALRESEAKYRQLFENFGDAVFIADASTGMIVDANLRAQHLSGYDLDTLLTMHQTQLHPAVSAEKTQRDFDLAVEGMVVLKEHLLLNATGLEIPVEINAAGVFEAGGKRFLIGMFRDITERLRAEDQNRQSRKRLRMVLDSIDALVYISDIKSHEILFINEYGRNTWGNVVGRKCWQALQSGMTGPCSFCEGFEVLAKDGSPQGVHRWEHKSTVTDRWYESRDSAITWDDGRLVRLAIATDITHRKEIEQRLLEQEQMYRGLVESQNDLIVRVNSENRLVFVNETYCRTFGKSREELIGRSFAPLVHEDDIQGTLQAMEQLKVSPHRCQLEQRAMTVDGWRWLHWEDSAILGEDGQIIEIQGVGRDITTLKQAEATLRNAEKRLSLAQTFARTGVWEFDIENSSLFWSRECEALFGLEEGEFERTYEAFLQMVHPDDRELVVKANEPIVDRAEGIPLEYEHRIIRKDGSVRWVKESAGVVRDEADNPVRIVGFVMDITEFKRVEEFMAKARQEAEAASRAKTTFLANMSHELRTPMNAVLGFADLLQRDPALTPEQAEKARLIHSNGQNLLRLINEILDMSKIEAGQATLNTEDFPLSCLLKETAGMFRTMAEAKGLGFAMEIDENLPEVIHADQGKLRQILFNLLGNAVKFTNSGQVILRCHLPADPGPPDAKGLQLSIEVEDTGPGIADQDMSLVFDPFHQTEAGIKAGGTGLGLPISREFAKLMDGSLTVSTSEGQGCRFHLTITVQPALGGNLHKTAFRQVVGLEPGIGSRRILIVDDRPDNLELLSELLCPVGFEVREATNGAEALEVFEAWPPHAVLMDMRMPVMDGYEATRRIKATEAGRRTFVVALTAWAYKDAREKGIAAGVDAHLSKPFKDVDLFNILAQGLDLSYVYAEDQAPEPPVVSATPTSPPDFPRPLIRAILEAVAGGDIFRLKELAAEAAQHDPRAAGFLRERIDGFDYKGISSWLGRG